MDFQATFLTVVVVCEAERDHLEMSISDPQDKNPTYFVNCVAV